MYVDASVHFKSTNIVYRWTLNADSMGIDCNKAKLIDWNKSELRSSKKERKIYESIASNASTSYEQGQSSESACFHAWLLY